MIYVLTYTSIRPCICVETADTVKSLVLQELVSRIVSFALSLPVSHVGGGLDHCLLSPVEGRTV